MRTRNKRSTRRRIIAGTLLSLLGFVWLANSTVLASSEGNVFVDVATVPKGRVALVLGTSPTFNGRPNLFFLRRIEAASKLYRAGKVERFLLSGDHGTPDYDEPTAMKKALVMRGVPENRITLDYAGFRTLDSIARAHRVFGLDRCVIVTDDFHLPRALYLAQHEGLGAVGFQTEPLPRSVSPITYFREVGSRSLVWLDVNILNTQPKFLGPRISV